VGVGTRSLSGFDLSGVGMPSGVGVGVGAAGVMPGLGVLVGEIVGEIEGEIGGGTSIGIEGSGLEGTGVGNGVGRERGG
jgi:hypothetical protein